ncbi:MAG: hypothetical protein U9O94_10425 [Nanoarchaeota archaeon]|nr:hypothetical protein [Nanoarchaeota archaeon]
MKNTILFGLILSIFLVGCQAPETSEPSEISGELITEIVTEGATEEVSIGDELSELDDLDKELGTEDLDSIDAELDEIDW